MEFCAILELEKLEFWETLELGKLEFWAILEQFGALLQGVSVVDAAKIPHLPKTSAVPTSKHREEHPHLQKKTPQSFFKLIIPPHLQTFPLIFISNP